MAFRFTQIFSLKTSLHKICENTGSHLPVFSRIKTESAIMSLCQNTGQWMPEYGSVKIRILAYFMKYISQTIILTHVYLIFCSNWDVCSKQIINLGSGSEIKALQFCRRITTFTITKLSFMNADTHNLS